MRQIIYTVQENLKCFFFLNTIYLENYHAVMFPKSLGNKLWLSVRERAVLRSEWKHGFGLHGAFIMKAIKPLPYELPVGEK